MAADNRKDGSLEVLSSHISQTPLFQNARTIYKKFLVAGIPFSYQHFRHFFLKRVTYWIHTYLAFNVKHLFKDTLSKRENIEGGRDVKIRILNQLTTEALTKRHLRKLQSVNSCIQLTSDLRETFVCRWGNFYQQHWHLTIVLEHAFTNDSSNMFYSFPLPHFHHRLVNDPRRSTKTQCWVFPKVLSSHLLIKMSIHEDL